MSTPAVIARIPTQPGKRDELVAALRQMIDAANAESGTVQYLLHTDDNDADVVWFYERYSDAAAFETHRSSEAMKAVGLAVRDLAAGRPELTMLTVVDGKGL